MEKRAGVQLEGRHLAFVKETLGEWKKSKLEDTKGKY